MKIGFTAGTFDLTHFGHVLMLEECKQVCDYLIVGVQLDPSVDRPHKNKPVQSMEERIGMIKAIRWVDEVVTYTTEASLVKLLKKIKPDIRILGIDWKDKKFTGYDLSMEYYFNSRDHDFSTSNLRQRILKAETEIKAIS